MCSAALPIRHIAVLFRRVGSFLDLLRVGWEEICRSRYLRSRSLGLVSMRPPPTWVPRICSLWPGEPRRRGSERRWTVELLVAHEHVQDVTPRVGTNQGKRQGQVEKERREEEPWPKCRDTALAPTWDPTETKRDTKTSPRELHARIQGMQMETPVE